MKFITYDPGTSTGWCLFEGGVPKAWGTIEHKDIQQALQNHSIIYHPEVVIAERAAVRGVGYSSLINGDVMGCISSQYPDVRWILPAAWKPLIAHAPKDLERFTKPRSEKVRPTRHELDAICIGLFALGFKQSLLEVHVSD